jgi:hypothetical protein
MHHTTEKQEENIKKRFMHPLNAPVINPRTGGPSLADGSCFGLTISNGKVVTP